MTPSTSLRHQHIIRSGWPIYSSASGNDSNGGFEVFNDETDETLLRINFSFARTSLDSDAKALDAVRLYTKSFPFAAVLPVQPLTYLPVRIQGGDMALKVTFLRKKTEEKDSKDGGIIFHCELAPNHEVDELDLDGDVRRNIHLVAKRISKGQTVSKVFSEKQIIMAFVKGLTEARGTERLMDGGNIQIDSLFHLWM
ncbi:hypothetical protein HJC23_013429 [Cyclotella cryptica]|uniref:Uncharacterized protein n=1 Tax=Cyclotella cryptica TaxID=29204 RepID=A0ABD3P2W9_9STRA